MKTYDAILLLGLKLEPDGSPKHELLLRCDKAAECYRRGMAPLVIPCGGRTEGTPVTECSVMTELLMQRGVPASAIRAEDRSQITVENFRNARALLGPKPRAAVVTSDYHMLRSLLIGRSAGLRCRGCRARVPRSETVQARRKEPLHLIDFLLGYQGTGKPRPKLYLTVMHYLLDRADRP